MPEVAKRYVLCPYYAGVEYARTESCQLPHVALVLSGALHVVMDDGSEEDFRKNDVMLLPPGHDAWTIGDEPCVFVEFSRGNDYYGAHWPEIRLDHLGEGTTA